MIELTNHDRWIVSRLVQPDWYAAEYPGAAGEEAGAHYRRLGAAAGHDPNPLFSTAWYLARYPEAGDSGLNALEHYVAAGAAAGHDPGPLFSTAWYLACNPDVAAAGMNPLDHYLEWGPRQQRDPSPVFDSFWYFGRYPDAKQDGTDACTHYRLAGARLGYAPCPLIDPAWYKQTYLHDSASGLDPLLHYLTLGASLGYDPGPQFSTLRYLETHPDVAAGRINPLAHFLAGGRLPAGPPPGALVNRLSAAAIQQAESLLATLKHLESWPRHLSEELDKLPVVAPLPANWESAWRSLYLSLTAAPRHVILVGRIDEAEGLAQLAQPPHSTLVLETDGAEVSIAGRLPPGVEWRSLSEFEPGLEPAGRLAVVRTLVASLRPALVTVRASRAGEDMLAHHAAGLSAHTRLRSAEAPA